MSETLVQSKATFIEYLLFRYTFKSRISVWILNLLKSSPDLLQQVHFIDEPIAQHNTLELATSNTEQPAIKLTLSDSQLVNSNEIFNYIAQHHQAIDIKIYFDTTLDREPKLDDLLIQQLLQSPYYAVYMHDIYSMPLSKQNESSIVAHLRDNIDLSLQMQDRALFYQLSQILNTFELRNMNSPSKD